MSPNKPGHRVQRAVGAALLALVAFAPSAAAQDEPAFVFPCVDGLEFEVETGQPIVFFCGWGTTGGPGLIRTFLNAHSGALTVEDDQGEPVLQIGTAEFATLWGEPESFPSGFDDLTCAAPTGWGVAWSYELENGLADGTYTVTLEESLRHPVTDGFHTCWFADGTRGVQPPDHLTGGSHEAISTLFVAD
jgi:hypothetical protein